MAILLWFLAVQTVLLMLILPLKFFLKASVSLGAEKAVLAVKIWSIYVAIIKLEKEKDVFRLSVNGKIIQKSHSKPMKISGNKMTPNNLYELFKDVCNLIEKVDIIAVVGGKDALSAGVNWGIMSNVVSKLKSNVDRCLIVPDFENDVFIVNGEVKFRIAILDVIELIGAYGITRNFKANNRQFEGSDQH